MKEIEFLFNDAGISHVICRDKVFNYAELSELNKVLIHCISSLNEKHSALIKELKENKRG